MEHKEYKKTVLEASKKVLEEYKNYEHSGTQNSCSLCKFFFDYDSYICKSCPMTVFTEHEAQLGCVERKCTMISQLLSMAGLRKVKFKSERVIKFYEGFIELTEKSRNCQLVTPKGNETLYAKRIKELDEKVYNEFNNINK